MVLSTMTMLLSCADRTRPAPVVNLSGSLVTTPTNKNTLTGNQHKVKSGETLYSIAWRSGKDVRTIAQLNRLPAPYKIYPGQILKLQGKVHKTTSSSSTTSKSNVKTSQKEQKSSLKVVANQKTQEYGESSAGNFTDVKVPSLTQKVKRWIWPVNGRVISSFSNSPQGNKGIDISGNKGKPIKAAADGLIVYAGNALRGYGNLIIIKHNDDYLSAYAHNDTLRVKEQQTIKAGTVIATMGNTGTDKTMLHFEIRFRGKSVNPQRYLPRNK
ncbi:peptidoglycan DD-metalloendopeptidase family protein [Thalassotalea psychrophila]|uniref:Peptidoglycan DD-metalloendopeptidase family protein n=1 Tax=Thalassotalea psychrophila TaxID=3065647 RepID=A0ABY9TRJ8_9GAMM|nr:peptidoglycan DD-metalloendopeptidase family protein [Colwelliaceae bacterium SQ149]